MATSATTAVATCTALLADARKVCIRLVDVNEHFVCRLCSGYLRDAQKVKECAHTFCNGCIRYFFWRDKRHNHCPVCKVSLGVKPWTMLVPDPAMQGLADKLLPTYNDKEKVEEREFYERLGLKRKRQNGKAANVPRLRSSLPNHTPSRDSENVPPSNAECPNMKIAFEMHPQRSPEMPLFLYLERLKQPRMSTMAGTRIMRLRKFIAMKLYLEKPDEVEILCKGVPVGAEYSLEFVRRTIWRDSSSKMILEYRKNVV